MSQFIDFRKEIDQVHEKAVRQQRAEGHLKYLEKALAHGKQQAKLNKNQVKVIESNLKNLNVNDASNDDIDVKSNDDNDGYDLLINDENLINYLLDDIIQSEILGNYFNDKIEHNGGEYQLELGKPLKDSEIYNNNNKSLTLSSNQSIKCLKSIKDSCKLIKVSLSVLYQQSNENETEVYLKLLLRRIPQSPEFVQEVRLAVCGNVDAGKSTLLGILSRGGLDDGRGKMRVNLFRHKHEVESGRTSSVGLEIMGFDPQGNEVQSDVQKHEKLSWSEICNKSSKVITFIDLAGHERYLKTTIFGLTGTKPDYAALIVGANAGLIGMSKEHLAISLALNVPVFICITKIDMAPPNVLEQTLKQLVKILKSSSCRKTPLFIKSKEEAIDISTTFVKDNIAPIFLISSVTGAGFQPLKSFLNLLPSNNHEPELIEQPFEFMINDIYSVPYAGTVVNGIVTAGSVRQNDNVIMGPDSLGNWISTSIKSLQRKRANVNIAEAGQSVSLALKKVRRQGIRKGQVIMAKQDPPPKAVKTFVGSILILYHSTTIKPSYQAMAHIGSVRQTVKVVRFEDDQKVLRTGDRASVVFEFVKNPEYIKVGMQLLFREGRTKGLGVITSIVDEQ